MSFALSDKKESLGYIPGISFFFFLDFLNPGLLITGTSKAWLGGFGEIGKPYTHPSTKQCSYAYTHPSTKQCNYSYTHPSAQQCTHNHDAVYSKLSHTHTDLMKLTEGCRIYVGSYTGTGTANGTSSNPTSLTFPFEPIFVYIIETPCQINTFYCPLITTSYKSAADYAVAAHWNDDYYTKMSSDRLTLYWYTTGNLGSSYYNKTQLNVKGTTYYYCIIG